MDLETKLKAEFGVVKSAFFESVKQEKFLRIEVGLTKIDEVVKYSRLIIDFLNHHQLVDDETNVDIYSSGVKQTVIGIGELQAFYNQKVLVQLKSKAKLAGKLVDINEHQITIAQNNKGKINKTNIEIQTIEEIVTQI